MTKLALNAARSAATWEPKYPFDFAVAYEDPLTRIRALRLYDHLAQRLLDDYDFHCNCWHLKDILSSTSRETATDAAAQADMVILSFHQRTALAPGVRAWIESWLRKRDGSKGALVALVEGGDDARDSAGSALQYLRSAARRGRMDFFTPSPRRDMELTPVRAESELEAHAQSRWGLNE